MTDGSDLSVALFGGYDKLDDVVDDSNPRGENRFARNPSDCNHET